MFMFGYPRRTVMGTATWPQLRNIGQKSACFEPMFVVYSNPLGNLGERFIDLSNSVQKRPWWEKTTCQEKYGAKFNGWQ